MSSQPAPKAAPEPAFHVLSDAELAQRSRQVTLIGLALVFLVSAVTVLLMFQKDESPAKAGPLHVVTTQAGHTNHETAGTPEGAPTPETIPTPKPPKPAGKQEFQIPVGAKGIVRNGRTVYEW